MLHNQPNREPAISYLFDFTEMKATLCNGRYGAIARVEARRRRARRAASWGSAAFVRERRQGVRVFCEWFPSTKARMVDRE